MPYNDRINHYIGMLDEELRLLLPDGSIRLQEKMIFPKGRPQQTEGVRVQFSFEPGMRYSAIIRKRDWFREIL